MAEPIQDNSERSDLVERYRQLAPTFERLRQETTWELAQAIDVAGIKLHSFPSRVKSEASFLEKIERKGYTDPWNQIEDLVGLRPVCLFRSDIRELEDVVRSCFTVTGQSDHVDGGDAESFGYMSVHFNARVHPDRAGPRYDDIKQWTFEVQIRTILMDAWANVSTYLDYKGQSSIPSSLRRDFFALSGLFYVADKHFELFFTQSQNQRAETVAELESDSSDLNVEINLDTLLGFLAARFPDRTHADASTASEVVEELTNSGYTTLSKLAEAYGRAEEAALAYEKANPPGPGTEPGRRFADVGIIRSALSILDLRFREVRGPRGIDPATLLEFEPLLRSST